MKEEINMRKYLPVFCLLFFALACTKDKEVAQTDLGLDYYPLSSGNYRIYELDSLFYNDFTSNVDTFHFLVKELTAGEFKDGSGASRFRLERYYRKTVSDPWIISDVWSVGANNTYASAIEENIHRVKLSFPVETGREWNANVFNADEADVCVYDFVDVPQTRSGISYSETLRTSFAADSSLISKRFSFEEYARGVGMIFKRYVKLEDRDSVIDLSRPLSNRIDYGFDVTYTLVEYGKN